MATNITGGVQIRVPTQLGATGQVEINRHQVNSLVQAAKDRYTNFDQIKDRFEFRLKTEDGQTMLELKQRNFWGRLKEATFGRGPERLQEREQALAAVTRALGSEPTTLEQVRSAEGLGSDRQAAKLFARQMIALLAADVQQVLNESPVAGEVQVNAGQAESVDDARMARGLQQSLLAAKVSVATYRERLAIDLPDRAPPLREVLNESLNFLEKHIANQGLVLQPVADRARLIGLIGQVLHIGKRQAAANELPPGMADRLNALRLQFYDTPLLQPYTVWGTEHMGNDPRLTGFGEFPGGEIYFLPFADDKVVLILGDAMEALLTGKSAPFGEGVQVLQSNANGNIEHVKQPGIVDEAHLHFDFMAEQLALSNAHGPTRAHTSLLFGADAAVRSQIESGLQSEFTPLNDDFVQKNVNVAIARCITQPELMTQRTDNWSQMSLKPEHTAGLREAMKQQGIADTDQNFGRFLLNLSAIYMKGSGTSHFGYESSSIISMRAYSFLLAEAAIQSDPGLEAGLDTGDFRAELRANVCADMVGNVLMGLAFKLDREMAESVIPAKMLANRLGVDDPGDAAIEMLDLEVLDIDDIGDRFLGLRR